VREFLASPCALSGHRAGQFTVHRARLSRSEGRAFLFHETNQRVALREIPWKSGDMPSSTAETDRDQREGFVPLPARSAS